VDVGELLFAPFGRTQSTAPGLSGRGASGQGDQGPASNESSGNPSDNPSENPAERERRRLWKLIWSECPGIGWQRLERLELVFGCLEQAWQASTEALAHRETGLRLGRTGLAQVEAYRAKLGPQPLPEPLTLQLRQRWRRRRCLLSGDPALPESLDELERPAVKLFWEGRGSLWPALRRQQAIAVVGTRRPSRHGETMARAIGQALAEAGWPVVSGLAEGIDAAAHEGCLERGGSPVGVLGTPLDRVYPRHHELLQRRVGDAGLLISEWGNGTPVQRGHFAERNRLLVALSQAVVLVECPEGSGALHSANLAWQREMPLWVVPGDAAKVSAAGSNRCLRRDAAPLLDPVDLVRDLGPGPLRRPEPNRPSAQQQRLHNREAALLAALGSGASLEQLCARLRQSPGPISRRLLELELAGVLRSEPGLWWRPC
jgi:DNA processing protein